MKICIHRGTHQIGGVATEISSATSRILIDLGDELSVDPDFVSSPLNVPGVTDSNGRCDAVLFTHHHGDHVGQMSRIRPGIPLYTGALTKAIMLKSAQYGRANDDLVAQTESMRTFSPGESFFVGDMKITPFRIDHSACDSCMFLVEADGKRVLHTGDFRLHGVRGKAMDKILERRIGKVDALIVEGTTLSRPAGPPASEWDLQDQLAVYLKRYKYVFVLCASTNLDRIFALAQAVPRGKYCLCDKYQYELAELVSEHCKSASTFYEMPKLLQLRKNPPADFERLGGLMFVRANRRFEQIIRKFDPAQSIILYSMWDGYRTAPESRIPEFLALTGAWESLHTGGHASPEAVRRVIEKADPEIVIPMHTDAPQKMRELCPDRTVALLQDGEAITL